jgi:RNA polymerase sigma factor (sigma-70 family)
MITHLTWEDLYEQSRKRLFARACRFANGNAALAEDFVQEAFVRVLSSPTIPGELKIPLAYLLRVLRTVAIDHVRKAGRARLESLDDADNVELQNELPITQPTIQRDLENEESLNAIRQHPAGLSSRERRLFDLVAEGNSCADISETLAEDPRITRSDLNALKAKIKYRHAPKNKGKQG